jgi:hypothetical protein
MMDELRRALAGAPGVRRWDGPAAPAASAARAGGWRCWVVDGRGAADKAAFLAACARDLELPAWFGGNWDALEDALGDLADRAEGTPGGVLIWDGWGALAAGPDDLRAALDVLRGAVARWSSWGMRLHVLLVGESPADAVV